MLKKTSWACGLLVLPALFCLALPGCAGKPSVPSSVDVVLPDGTTVTATLGSGVISLADSVWAFCRSATNPECANPFVVIHFSSTGSLESFEDNTIAREIFGDTILFDGIPHNTAQPALQYVAGTFGAETSDSSGFTFEGHLTALAAGFEAAVATATAMAEFDPEDSGVVYGTFTFSSQVLLFPELFPGGNIDESFAFAGRRLE